MLSMTLFGAYAVLGFLVAILLNVAHQLLFRRWNKTEPPMVFHWIPFLGSTISYGIDPYKFFVTCQEKVSRLPGCIEGLPIPTVTDQQDR